MSGIDAEFDYAIPEQWQAQLCAGSIVRVDLNGRRVRAWVVDADSKPPEGVKLRPITKLSGAGPDQSLIDLAGWAAWRWAGKRSFFLGSSSPSRNVGGLLPEPQDSGDGFVALVRKVPPATSAYSFVRDAVAAGPTLVLVPSHRSIGAYVDRLRNDGLRVAQFPDDWAQVARGGVSAIGSRAAVWARIPQIEQVIVVDSHDEAYQSERSPTWNAAELAIERARRAGVPCQLLSPVPRLADIKEFGVADVDRVAERFGWAAVHIVDLRQTDPRNGIYSPALVDLLRSDKKVICVLNRKGRAQLLICAKCDEIARCEKCAGALHETDSQFECARCNSVQPVVCHHCGSGKFKHLRPGISRMREDLESLALREVGELDGDSDDLPATDVIVGTEAVLHRVRKADAVIFIDFDQELMAPRFRASEESLILLARASRIVGGRARGGVVVVQTRQPEHEVISAATYGDPDRFYDVEMPRRKLMDWPPFSAIARISGKNATTFVGSLAGVDVLGPVDNAYLVKSRDSKALCDALAAVPRPTGHGLRVEVDPYRI